MEFIAIDIGTSFTKGAIVDVDALKIRNVSRRAAPQPLRTDNRLFHELDPVSVIAGVREIIAELHAESPDCCGILLCGQMGGLVLCTESGDPVRPYISWLDRRPTERCGGRSSTVFESMSQLIGDRSAKIFGNEFRPGLPLSFLFWLQRTGELDRYPDAFPATLPDFVAAALCQTQPVMEWTSTTGSLDVFDRCFPTAVFEELGLHQLRWPEIVDFRHCVGEYFGAGRPLPVYAATGDHQCSLAGTLLRTGELSLNISTGSQVSMLTDRAEVGDFQIRPYFDGVMLKTITNIPAGRSLSAIMKLLTEMCGDEIDEQAAWQYFFDQATTTHMSDVRVNLALFPGAIVGPGSFSNLREDNLTVGHIARSSLEQMADYYQQLSSRLDPTASWSSLAFSGGIAQQSALLRDLITTRLQATCRVATSSEDALQGMMVLGRVIGGLHDTVTESSSYVAAQLES